MSNPHFSPFFRDNDAELIHSLNEEMIYDRGVSVEYMPVKFIVEDGVMNEVLASAFDEARSIDVFMETSDSYIIPNAMLDFSGMGFGASSIKVHVGKRKFEEFFPESEPVEGDLFYIRQLDRIFEVIEVDNTDPLLSGGRYFTFGLSVQPYSYSEGSQHFDTDSIDMQNVEQNITEMLRSVDDRTYSDIFADFSSAEITMDHRAQFAENDWEKFTFDSTNNSLTGYLTFDDTSADMSNHLVTFDLITRSYKEDDQNIREMQNDLLSGFSSNHILEDETEDVIRKTSTTNPFGFL